MPGKTSTLDINLRAIDTSYSTGYGIAGAYGVALDNGFRLENELAYRQASGKQSAGDMWQLSWLLNIWYDIKNSTPATPYLGGGFGYGRGRLASPGIIDESGSGLAWQVGGGVNYRISQQLSLGLGFRYVGISDLFPAGSAVVAGVKVKF